jgi:hypothetical protein
MEPANLNSSASDDGRIEALLRSSAPLADLGFSKRVLAALPPRRSTMRSLSRLRRFVCLAGFAVGVMVAVAGYLLWPEFRSDSAESIASAFRNVTLLLDPGVALALTIAAVSLLYAFWPASRRIPAL